MPNKYFKNSYGTKNDHKFLRNCEKEQNMKDFNT